MVGDRTVKGHRPHPTNQGEGVVETNSQGELPSIKPPERTEQRQSIIQSWYGTRAPRRRWDLPSFEDLETGGPTSDVRLT